MNSRVALITLASCGALLVRTARAEQNIVRQPNRHPSYAFELEPHLLFAPVPAPGVGAGVRGTVVLAQEGFIDSINDSVGLGFGLDWTRDKTWIPVVMQWNFWLSEHWSVFGEPGIALRWDDRFRSSRADVTLYGGARLRLSERVSFTGRVGYPGLTLGISFLL